MKEALNDIPNMEVQVAKCEKLIALLKKNRPGTEEAPKSQTKAQFVLPDEPVKPAVEKAAESEQPTAEEQGEEAKEPTKDMSPLEFKL
jgi:hypothetical protein